MYTNRCLHVFAQKSLKLNITNTVNDTPHIILEKINTHSLNGFSNYVKLFLLQTFQDTCTVPNGFICSLSNLLLNVRVCSSSVRPFVRSFVRSRLWYFLSVLDRKLLERLMSPSPKSQVMFASAFSCGREHNL